MGIFDFFSRRKKQAPEESLENAPAESHLLEHVEIKPGITVPKALAIHWQEIEKTRLPFISIKATPTDDLSLEQSKFGHYPCLPAGYSYPLDRDGNFMYPLAQINFKEVPALDGYPTSGYLQFYISITDSDFGLSFNDFRVLYFEEHEVENYMTDFSFLDDIIKDDENPVHAPHSLAFSAQDDYVGMNDVRYEKNPVIDVLIKNHPSIEDDLEDAACGIFSSNGHKIGGYAYFTQSDPRTHDEDDRFADYILLFQIDSDDQVMWGDMGVANFFIHPDDLAKKDFSKVMYNWDCS